MSSVGDWPTLSITALQAIPLRRPVDRVISSVLKRSTGPSFPLVLVAARNGRSCRERRGVPATQVAEWAGHSVEVLLKVYAKCLDGHDEVARRRVQEALGYGTSAERYPR